jgi:hypothetical protein
MRWNIVGIGGHLMILCQLQNILRRFKGVTIDGVWIGYWIYRPLLHTTRNYKQLQCYR